MCRQAPNHVLFQSSKVPSHPEFCYKHRHDPVGTSCKYASRTAIHRILAPYNERGQNDFLNIWKSFREIQRGFKNAYALLEWWSPHECKLCVCTVCHSHPNLRVRLASSTVLKADGPQRVASTQGVPLRSTNDVSRLPRARPRMAMCLAELCTVMITAPPGPLVHPDILRARCSCLTRFPHGSFTVYIF